jgi:uncharacterized protein (UPF0332 family)
MPSGKREIDSHRRLAEGFLVTSQLSASATEIEVRNAISRGYYAVYHICNAWLASENVPASRRRQHVDVQQEVGRKLGDQYKSRLHDLHALRKDADYTADWLSNHAFLGDLERFRIAGLGSLGRMHAEFDVYRFKLRGAQHDDN